MEERYIKYKIESIVNKLLYEKNVIDKNLYKEASAKIDKLIFEENKKNFTPVAGHQKRKKAE